MKNRGKRIYRGRIVDLYSVRAELPNKVKTDLEIIRHPGAALIVPLLDDHTLIMLKQFRYAVGSFIYELPAGTLARGEQPRVCAARELEEETGYTAGKLVKLGHIFPVPGYSTEKIVIFKATGLKRTRKNLDGDEIITPIIMTKNGIRRLFRNGRIVDAKTICGLAMAGWL